MRRQEIKERKSRDGETSDDERTRLKYNEYQRKYKFANNPKMYNIMNQPREEDKAFFKKQRYAVRKYRKRRMEEKRDGELESAQTNEKDKRKKTNTEKRN